MTELLTSPIYVPLFVALVLFVAVWPISVLRSDASLVDLAWGPGFIIQLCVAVALSGATGTRTWLVVGLVGLWSLRLSFVLMQRRYREGHEDPRYTLLRESWDPGFWWKSLGIVFLLQSVLQWVIVLGPITTVLSQPAALGVPALLGGVMALAGIALEWKADMELDQFKRTAAPGQLLQSGLRAHVRHPNYVGEILFWIGIALIALEAGAMMGLLSPVLLTILLTKVSGVPLLDERLSATRPAYAAYRARVPGFIPRLSREANQ